MCCYLQRYYTCYVHKHSWGFIMQPNAIKYTSGASKVLMKCRNPRMEWLALVGRSVQAVKSAIAIAEYLCVFPLKQETAALKKKNAWNSGLSSSLTLKLK